MRFPPLSYAHCLLNLVSHLVATRSLGACILGCGEQRLVTLGGLGAGWIELPCSTTVLSSVLAKRIWLASWMTNLRSACQCHLLCWAGLSWASTPSHLLISTSLAQHPRVCMVWQRHRKTLVYHRARVECYAIFLRVAKARVVPCDQATRHQERPPESLGSASCR